MEGGDEQSSSASAATIDPDDFSVGFGTWSGTSFAAPYLAGELAQALLAKCTKDLDSCDRGDAVKRSWAAIEACTEIVCP